MLNMKPCSCNLICCLPAPLIVADVLALKSVSGRRQGSGLQGRDLEPT